MASLNKLIDLDLLETFGKGTIVPMLKTIEALSASLQALDSKVDTLDANIGVLANLETTDKTNLVNAINELKAGGGGGSSVLIVPFASGTDAQIKAMLDAYYNDEITWLNMGWKVGDTRTIHFNDMPAPNPNSSETWVAQDITVAIVTHDHHELATSINGHNKGCITVQCREVINNNSSALNQIGRIYVNGDSTYDTIFTKWADLYMRTYLNNTVWAAIPSGDFKSAIKESKHYRHTAYNTSTSELVTDKLFLPSYPEIYGTASHSIYTVTSPTEGAQLEYYLTAANRIKNGNNNGASNSIAQYWWMGSPSSHYSSSYGYFWGAVDSDGGTIGYPGNGACGLAPAFVM